MNLIRVSRMKNKDRAKRLSTSQRWILWTISILVSSLIIISGVKIFVKRSNESKLLERKGEDVVFSVVKFEGGRPNYSTFKYIVDNKEYSCRVGHAMKLHTGELRSGKVLKSNPSIFKINFSKYVISDASIYAETSAKIISVVHLAPPYGIRFSYRYRNKEFKREVHCENPESFKKEQFVRIMVNIKDPRIAYVIN